jgi:hypothetical protein
MSALDAALAAYSARDGVAYRRGNFRHRRLTAKPIAMVMFQLSGEPFTVAALAYGQSSSSFEQVTPGQPLDRVQLFEALLPVAIWFNQVFELPWGMRNEVTIGVRQPRTVQRASFPPQLIVPNPGSVRALRNLGRRLAYLPTEATEGGPPPAPLDLVRFGRHLQFLARQHRESGQQLILDMVSLAADGWMTAQTSTERANLAALDAWIEPGLGRDGFMAASVAETIAAGPLPSPDQERDVELYMTQLDDARKTGDAGAEAQARADIAHLYRGLIEPAWAMMWRVRDREANHPEEPRFTPRRVDADITQYSSHMEWMDGPVGGRRRTRDSVRGAIFARRRAESDVNLVAAEEACSDPLRMVTYLLDNKAVEGEVDPFDFDHVEVKPGNTRATSAPRIRLRTRYPCMIPIGRELWWTAEPARVHAIVEAVDADPTGAGSIVTLTITGGTRAATPLRTAISACFSILSTDSFSGYLPIAATDPFTHVPDHADPTTAHIEPEGDAAEAAAPATP